jgi:hypothetical protein
VASAIATEARIVETAGGTSVAMGAITAEDAATGARNKAPVLNAGMDSRRAIHRLRAKRVRHASHAKAKRHASRARANRRAKRVHRGSRAKVNRRANHASRVRRESLAKASRRASRDHRVNRGRRASRVRNRPPVPTAPYPPSRPRSQG